MAALIFNLLSSARDTLQLLLMQMKNSTPSLFSSSALLHEVVTFSQIGDRTVLIVGDIHGCYDELQELIKTAKESTIDQELYLVCVGDMLNKGPKSKKVLVFLRDLMDRGMASAVKGNHEEVILKHYSCLCKDKDYALPRRYTYLKEFEDEDFAFIKSLPYSISIPHLNIIIVHAGLVPGIPLHRQSIQDLCQMRNVETNIRFPWGLVSTAHRKPIRGVAWATKWEGPQHVYFGHDCRRGLQQLPFATGLDTGCVYGDKLTGVLLGGRSGIHTLLSVPARCQHYAGKQQVLLEECST
ncbi:Bis(5'-nucleosyl)-tetraphosphatase, symmetrical [Elysia marginata]|uniref:Bis(5'-nucleosyl)-tetraphosphatase, symmetrical n=1 Tax=Elysia marginata TaxID=1093978 RepID=A0AAV4GTN3_9GAST|nr:Bis(5'-nucleosyl)-tetraphosphatase, symmetrical [Elysia marginata]